MLALPLLLAAGDGRAARRRDGAQLYAHATAHRVTRAQKSGHRRRAVAARRRDGGARLLSDDRPHAGRRAVDRDRATATSATAKGCRWPTFARSKPTSRRPSRAVRRSRRSSPTATSMHGRALFEQNCQAVPRLGRRGRRSRRARLGAVARPHFDRASRRGRFASAPSRCRSSARISSRMAISNDVASYVMLLQTGHQPAFPPYRSSGPVPEGALGYLAIIVLVAFVFTFWRVDTPPARREEAVRRDEGETTRMKFGRWLARWLPYRPRPRRCSARRVLRARARARRRRRRAATRARKRRTVSTSTSSTACAATARTCKAPTARRCKVRSSAARWRPAR